MEELSAKIVLKLLDWPFLLFTGLAILVFIFKSEFASLISRGGFTLVWGDKSFKITELPEQLNESFAPVSDDIEDIKARLEALETGKPEPQVKQQGTLNEEQTNSAKERMLDALTHGQYRWRSIERLASIGIVNQSQAEDILRPLSEVVFSRGKSGRTIARLKSR